MSLSGITQYCSLELKILVIYVYILRYYTTKVQALRKVIGSILFNFENENHICCKVQNTFQEDELSKVDSEFIGSDNQILLKVIYHRFVS